MGDYKEKNRNSHNITAFALSLTFDLALIRFNIIYNKNSPTSAGSEMNCRSEHKCSKEFYK